MSFIKIWFRRDFLYFCSITMAIKFILWKIYERKRCTGQISANRCSSWKCSRIFQLFQLYNVVKYKMWVPFMKTFFCRGRTYCVFLFCFVVVLVFLWIFSLTLKCSQIDNIIMIYLSHPLFVFHTWWIDLCSVPFERDTLYIHFTGVMLSCDVYYLYSWVAHYLCLCAVHYLYSWFLRVGNSGAFDRIRFYWNW